MESFLLTTYFFKVFFYIEKLEVEFHVFLLYNYKILISGILKSLLLLVLAIGSLIGKRELIEIDAIHANFLQHHQQSSQTVIAAIFNGDVKVLVL